MGRSYEFLGFESAKDYGQALLRVPREGPKRVFAKQTVAMQMESKATESKGEYKRVLNVWDLICLGVGMMLGAGVFVTTGFVAATLAGPAVILSYAVAGLSALLSSLCYAEFATSIPLSGGAYSYVSAVFGEFLAWITVANLILEYILANAAAIRGFAPYFSMLVNKPADYFITPWTSPLGTSYNLDWWAMGWCLLITALLVLGTKESARFNVVMTVLHMLLVVFIIIAGLVKSKPSNAQPFFPFEVRGVFNGAALVFFSYIGFDSLSCSAEEVVNPGRDLPLGILGALGVVTVSYMLMSAALVMMVPVDKIELGAPFAAAFSYVGMDWARYIVALGALMGIITTTLVGMYATSRIIAAVARAHLLPPFLARVHHKFGTPYISTVLSGVAAAIMALFTDFADLADMVSISTLFAFWIVALALIWNRYYKQGVSPRRDNYKVAAHMAVIVACSVVFTICYQLLRNDFIGMIVCAAVGVAATISLHLTCTQYNVPTIYGVWFFPYVPALSVGLNCFLLGQLKPAAYERFGLWTAFVTVFYLIYCIPAGLCKDKHDTSLPRGDAKDTYLPTEKDVVDAGGKSAGRKQLPGAGSAELELQQNAARGGDAARGAAAPAGSQL